MTVRQADQGAVVIGKHEFERLIARVADASHGDVEPLLDAIGQQQEDSARRRITETKTSPDGEVWAPWSPRYAATRGPQHSLLRGTGALADSMTHEVNESDKSVSVGSNLVYAGAHLFGSVRLPQRAYLDTEGGFADSHDRAELRDIVRAFMKGLL